jgi:UDP-N-acetylglucosamine--N-acetylmuramyl-(pentapeptide) pyrophosphoryl-undecaprenol N-acetylglucosamine transferase
MMARGWTAELLSDARGLAYPGLFDGVERHVIPAASVGGANPLAWARGLRTNWQGRAAARRIYRRRRPAAVVGFGGYPAFPALLGAFAERVPTVVHDSNSVLGRVNRLLAGRVDAIATAFPDTQRLDPRHAAKVAVVGNPVRADIVALRDAPFPGGDMLNLLVVGGSQGATILSTVVPQAVAAMRAKVRVVQQCRPEDIDAVRAAYAAAGIDATLSTYIADMPSELANAHVVISRSGASTVSELAVAGRPSILVPLPTAMDDHQSHNVRELADAGGCVALAQADFTPSRVAEILDGWASDRAALAAVAAAARSTGRADAAARLADLVERVATPQGGSQSSASGASA